MCQHTDNLAIYLPAIAHVQTPDKQKAALAPTTGQPLATSCGNTPAWATRCSANARWETRCSAPE
eukprot:gene21618-biopygen23645